ncbi:MAG TPA: hypothetical protein VGN14_12490 [Candidatus Elarobacter sp.]|jgi:hypothetical protein
MHALVLAASLCPAVRLARVHLVDGMPFVDALRPTLRAQPRPDRSGPAVQNGFVLTDAGREVGYIVFAPDGSVEVRGLIRSDPAGRFVDVEAPPPPGCAPRAAARVTLRPAS